MGERIGRRPDREHTFRSGRSAVIREVHNAVAVFGNPVLAPYMADYEAGQLTDPAVAVAICREVVRLCLVEPRLVDDDADVGEGVVTLEDLMQDEIDELVELWQVNIEAAATFREVPAGQGRGGGGAGVGGKSKPRAGAAGGKR